MILKPVRQCEHVSLNARNAPPKNISRKKLRKRKKERKDS